MLLILEKSQTIIATQIQFADSFFTRFIGWMAKRTINDNECLIIHPCNSVHTFFMKFEIDILFLDESDYILSIREQMRPFRLTPIVQHAVRVVELKGGTIQQFNIEIGDRIVWGGRAGGERISMHNSFCDIYKEEN
ncbi:DUF192 domain-containing protein [Paenibacillus qinlingensis]|uniref:Uncharacterized membrane protein (UPF0127 family) n=1 Tax=Paenibacillus qinlingensis TaxID=1837343 RepID=A0ABU1NVV4_9BACL|nr:DUF192 domain-containing protein [Paenibacillus qinlingensis]MDR6551570.1 uncharacterized membrane protein (UPF0127 family) [Paenibacillus qinlingensis]